MGPVLLAVFLEKGVISANKREMKETILGIDMEKLLEDVEDREDAKLIVRVEREVGWLRLWDWCRDYGPKAIAGLRSFVRIVTYPSHARNYCPKCETENLDEGTLLGHFLVAHSTAKFNSEELLASLFDDFDL